MEDEKKEMEEDEKKEPSQVFCTACKTCVNVDEMKEHLCIWKEERLICKYRKIMPVGSTLEPVSARVEELQEKGGDVLESILGDIEKTQKACTPWVNGKDEDMGFPWASEKKMHLPRQSGKDEDVNFSPLIDNNNNFKKISFIDLTHQKEEKNLKCPNCGKHLGSNEEAGYHLLECTLFESI